MSCGSTQLKETPEAAIGGPEGLKGSIAEPEEVQSSETDKKAARTAKVVSFSNAEGVGEIMNFLASDELQGRDSGSEGIAKAATYIENIFKENINLIISTPM